MADSVSPYGIPESFRAYRNRGVAPYVNGRYAWPAAAVRSFPRRLAGIDVNATRPDLGDVLDCERFDATPQDWPDWRARRVALVKEGHARGWPKVYTSIAPGGGYGVGPLVTVTEERNQEPIHHWWIAWYVYPHVPAAAEVVAEVERLTGFRMAESDLFGCQYGTLGGYDISVIYQDPEWQ